MNEIISTLRPRVVRNEYNEETTEWKTEIPSLRAGVQYTAESRRIESGINEVVFPASVVFKIRIHYKHRIQENDRIVWQGVKYRILSIEPNREYQQITIRVEKLNE